MMKFHSEDNGNCRVYFKRDNHLYCWQSDEPDNFTFYRCSRDGEPQWIVRGFTGHSAIDLTPVNPGETSICQELNEFLAKRRNT